MTRVSRRQALRHRQRQLRLGQQQRFQLRRDPRFLRRFHFASDAFFARGNTGNAFPGTNNGPHKNTCDELVSTVTFTAWSAQLLLL